MRTKQIGVDGKEPKVVEGQLNLPVSFKRVPSRKQEYRNSPSLWKSIKVNRLEKVPQKSLLKKLKIKHQFFSEIQFQGKCASPKNSTKYLQKEQLIFSRAFQE